MANLLAGLVRSSGQDALLDGAVRALTPPLREIYAVLVRAGVVVIVDD
ncbi:Rv1535 domain-containing protein [Mycolicibacterium litorale]